MLEMTLRQNLPISVRTPGQLSPLLLRRLVPRFSPPNRFGQKPSGKRLNRGAPEVASGSGLDRFIAPLTPGTQFTVREILLQHFPGQNPLVDFFFKSFNDFKIFLNLLKILLP